MLFPSTLFICRTPVSIRPYLEKLGHLSIENNPDILVISDYTVENIRSINKFLSQKPYSHSSKIVYIPNCHLLNLESQNTLLKNLEEPGKNSYFILTTTRPSALLPTIVSRCHQIRLKIASIPTINKQLSFSGSPSEKLLLSEKLTSDKNSLLLYLEDQLINYQEELIKNPTQENAVIIKKIIRAVQMLNANVDPKAAIDFLLLS